MKLSLPDINWPTAMVLSFAIAAMVATFNLIAPEHRLEALTTIASVAIPLLAAMESLFKSNTISTDPLDAPTPPKSESNGRLHGRAPSLKRSWFAGLVMLGLGGCAPSTLQVHATVASVTGAAFDTACHEVEITRSREQHAVADGPLDRDASKREVDAIRARWAPALISCELAADGHDAWVDALALAAAGAPFTLLDGITLARHALELWGDLSAALAQAGIVMPAAPIELHSLVGGAL